MPIVAVKRLLCWEDTCRVKSCLDLRMHLPLRTIWSTYSSHARSPGVVQTALYIVYEVSVSAVCRHRFGWPLALAFEAECPAGWSPASYYWYWKPNQHCRWPRIRVATCRRSHYMIGTASSALRPNDVITPRSWKALRLIRSGCPSFCCFLHQQHFPIALRLRSIPSRFHDADDTGCRAPRMSYLSLSVQNHHMITCRWKVTAWTFTSLAFLSTLGRFYIHWQKNKRWRWDDYLNGLALLFLLGFTVTYHLFAPVVYDAQMFMQGLGGKLPTEAEYNVDLRINTANNFLFFSTIYTVKASFLALYWQIFEVSMRFRIAWILVSIYTAASFLASFLSVFWECVSPKHFLDAGWLQTTGYKASADGL